MNNIEAMSYIEQLGTAGSVPGLERIRELLFRMGDPQDKLNIIHVAGTNGKGSVSTMIASVLQTAGYSVGRYISPTLFEYAERFQINGVYISGEDFASLMTMIKIHCEAMRLEGFICPTAFEAETALAFLYFKQKQCDFVVLEVGLGGREDATNVLKHPLMTVFTSIGLDHTGILGDTVEKIAWQKGGIIRPGSPVIIDDAIQAATGVLEEIAYTLNAPVYKTNRMQIVFEEHNTGVPGEIISYRDIRHAKLSLAGIYQSYNAALAIEAICCLRTLSAAHYAAEIKENCSRVLTEECICRGLQESRWPGRFDILRTSPVLIVDGAHNPAGVQALSESLLSFAKGRRMLLLAGIFADKDYPQMLQMMSKLSDTFIAYKAPGIRGLPQEQLAACAAQYFAQVYSAPDADGALCQALELQRSDDVIVAFGSLSTVSGIYKAADKYCK